MSFIYRIIGYLVDLADFFYDLMLEVWDWPWPFWLIGYIFYAIHDVFAKLAWRFTDFAEWLEWAADEIEEILSWSNIRSLIRAWLTGIENLIAWFSDWWDNVWDVVEDWWTAAQRIVKGWIKVVSDALDALIAAWETFWKVVWPEWTGKLSELRSLWDNFWEVIFPTLVNFSWLTSWWNDRLVEVDKLINDTIKTWFPFYDDLVKLWGEIKLFFTSPLDWLWGKFADWFLGPET